MKIPEQIKVGGHVYKIIWHDDSVLQPEFRGKIDYQTCEIHVMRGMSESATVQTILHELIHAMFTHIGIVDHDENQAEALAQIWLSIIVDNPNMFAVEESDVQ